MNYIINPAVFYWMSVIDSILFLEEAVMWANASISRNE